MIFVSGFIVDMADYNPPIGVDQLHAQYFLLRLFQIKPQVLGFKAESQWQRIVDAIYERWPALKEKRCHD